MRAASVALLLALSVGCSASRTEPEKKQEEKDKDAAEVKIKVGGKVYTADQLADNHKALGAYSAWEKKWFPGKEHWESRREFKGTRGDVPEALAELDRLIKDWPGTPAAKRAATLKKIVQDAAKPDVPDEQFRERMAWACRDEYKASFPNDK